MQGAVAQVPEYHFSPQVQKAKDQMQLTLNTLFQMEQEDKNAKVDPALKKLMLKNDEKQITRYVDQQKKLFVQHMNDQIQHGDATATVALLEFALFFNDDELQEKIDLAPLQQLSDQNDAYASYLLAQQFKLTKDYIPLLEKAGQQGSVAAQMTLADEYGFRLPVEQQDAKKAAFWANKAKQNLGEAAYTEQKCALANCDLEEFEMVDFSKQPQP
ncbi:sel1 repeat family protein [Acinetobacter sp. A47]|uniref:sel1 repeat family protein n=1 Tax=Acinetobacter sp. A47 TaxID=1561217 RepID=UPI000A4832A7|nr:sel1 repeat family protein [Acinetobacter sp. A47]